MGHHNVVYNLGTMLAKAGKVEEVERWLRQAASTGDAHAARNLTILLAKSGRTGEAERWNRQASQRSD
ncbi:hypothetical protein ACWGH8_33395 [Nonomuraea muscovyensis]